MCVFMQKLDRFSLRVDCTGLRQERTLLRIVRAPGRERLVLAVDKKTRANMVKVQLGRALLLIIKYTICQEYSVALLTSSEGLSIWLLTGAKRT